MRMTNKIMQNNSLYNINNNKLLQDQLSTSMATQKKLTRPSDDPIIAIRALRLRTSVSELSQFLDKNAKDADAWLTVTEDALSTASSIIGGSSGLISLMTKAANKDLTPSDLDNIMQQIKSLRDEIYATANVDYAGRYIFTGYRTDTPLSFTKDVLREGYNVNYNIMEQIDINAFDTVNYTDQQWVLGLSRNNYADGDRPDIEEQHISNSDIHRLRLSYDNVGAGTAPVINCWDTSLTPPGYTDFTATIPAANYRTISVDAALPNDPYQTIQAMNDPAAPILGVVFVPETGEILFSNLAFEALRDLVDANPNNEIRISYEKDSWKEGDLRPEHYFSCQAIETKDGRVEAPIRYNGYQNDHTEIVYIGSGQIIEYDVGYNQRIRINTLAEDIFRHTTDRDVDDLDRAVIELMAIQRVVDDMRALMDNPPAGADVDIIQKQLDAATKAYDFIRDNVHRMFENGITKLQTALDAVNVAVTDSGTRSARLDLISNRLISQKTTFEVLKSENEDADIAEVAIKLTSTELSYNAALMATGKIMQTSLMNFI